MGETTSGRHSRCSLFVMESIRLARTKLIGCLHHNIAQQRLCNAVTSKKRHYSFCKIAPRVN